MRYLLFILNLCLDSVFKSEHGLADLKSQHGIPRTNVPGLNLSFFRIISCYARMYCVPGYTSQPRPGQPPLSRGSSLEPRDVYRTIPSNREIPGILSPRFILTLLPPHILTCTYPTKHKATPYEQSIPSSLRL